MLDQLQAAAEIKAAAALRASEARAREKQHAEALARREQEHNDELARVRGDAELRVRTLAVRLSDAVYVLSIDSFILGCD